MLSGTSAPTCLDPGVFRVFACLVLTLFLNAKRRGANAPGCLDPCEELVDSVALPRRPMQASLRGTAAAACLDPGRFNVCNSLVPAVFNFRLSGASAPRSLDPEGCKSTHEVIFKACLMQRGVKQMPQYAQIHECLMDPRA